ncbi:hypothetical protein ABR737_43205 [Streptomyces sp. Edi2]|uniref:hypothetical protein n=1 Tax=Streptomyces sp. Edi2 TaxID=3162528 RepID=UPI003306114C
MAGKKAKVYQAAKYRHRNRIFTEAMLVLHGDCWDNTISSAENLGTHITCPTHLPCAICHAGHRPAPLADRHRQAAAPGELLSATQSGQTHQTPGAVWKGLVAGILAAQGWRLGGGRNRTGVPAC